MAHKRGFNADAIFLAVYRAIKIVVAIVWFGVKVALEKRLYLYAPPLIIVFVPPLAFLLENVLPAEPANVWATIPEGIQFGILFCIISLLFLFALGLSLYREIVALQTSLDSLGLSNAQGKMPRVVSIEARSGLKKMARIESFGIGPENYIRRKDDLQGTMNWEIEQIGRDANNPIFIKILLTKKRLPRKIGLASLMGEIGRPYQFVVGKSQTGVIVANLEELPHLLIAGVTGRGKSTFLNSVLMALLKSPKIKIYGIDLKMVELAIYKDFPHFRMEDTMASALQSLRGLKSEMEARYEHLARHGLRKIDSIKGPFDRIVLVVDECSDLFGKVERNSIDYKMVLECREIANILARKGRAAGVHLILATQRASANSLDSRILANIPARVCFKMASVSNSVLVIGTKDAFHLEDIPGRGLWSLGTELKTFQAPFITIEEIKGEVQKIKNRSQENQGELAENSNLEVRNFGPQTEQNQKSGGTKCIS